MAWNSVIRSDDANAVQLLTENLAHLNDRNAYMQRADAYYEEHGTMKGFEDLTEEQAFKVDAYVGGEQTTPYENFRIDNRKSAERIHKNIDRVMNEPHTLFQGWQFEGGEAIVNLANNRLQLMFNKKPSEEIRNALKQNGFIWANKSGAWQRPLIRKAFEAANRIYAIKPLDGRKVMDLQPKAPKRDAPER
ncbi:MAG: hypothetical protein IJH36_03950 [Clostridia bacterium]|nr:hypothetical protein [Clostridia bacterium]